MELIFIVIVAISYIFSMRKFILSENGLNIIRKICYLSRIQIRWTW